MSRAVLFLALAFLVHAQEPPRESKQENKQQTSVNVTAMPTLNVAKDLAPEDRNAIANRIDWLKRGLRDEQYATNLYVIGWIQYLDEAKRIRKMGFCRKYNFKTERFQREQDEDYEYDD